MKNTFTRCALLALISFGAFAQAPLTTPFTNVSAATLGANTFTGTQTIGISSGYAATFTGGNVGIGTTSPSALFSVGSTSQFQVNTSGQASLNGLNYTAVVAKADATAQAANIGTTTLFAVPASAGGMYRASCYVVLTQAATTSATLPACDVWWTDLDTSVGVGNNLSNSYGTNTVGINLAGLGSPGYPGSLTINAKASTNISYSTAGYTSVGATPMQYAIHVKLTYLGN